MTKTQNKEFRQLLYTAADMARNGDLQRAYQLLRKAGLMIKNNK